MENLGSGKSMKMVRITGITASGKLAAHFFDIESLKALVGERVTVHFMETSELPEASKIELQYLFSGESMPARIRIDPGESSAGIVGSGRCPCGVD